MSEFIVPGYVPMDAMQEFYLQWDGRCETLWFDLMTFVKARPLPLNPDVLAASQEPVGIALDELKFNSMPGPNGFTICTFPADIVPHGTELYTLESLGIDVCNAVVVARNAQ